MQLLETTRKRTSYSIQSFLAYFIVAAPLVNLVALFKVSQPSLLHIIQLFVFLYVIITPGLFLLPFLIKKKLPFMLGIALSAALSIFALMLVGLGINTFLPMLGISAPLTVLPLLISFDVLIFTLFILNHRCETEFALELPSYNRQSAIIVGIAVLLPILSLVGTLSLNNGGSPLMTMVSIGTAIILIPLVFLKGDRLEASVAPVVLYMAALALLLMNAMRGQFITGHDILLEYHVYTITNDAHLWKMAFYQDPYNACLSLTILPTYLQAFLHANTAYMFKFFIQFIGALPVVVVYYLSKKFIADRNAFLVGFLYIAFPTFMVDMAFLNRQGIAFLFFSGILFALFDEEYITEQTKTVLMFLFGTGMIFSHYSTSYIAIPLLIITYILNRLLRWLSAAKRPSWLFRLMQKIGNREMYRKPILLKGFFVIGLLVIMVVWSTFITKTSTSFQNTIHQIIVSLKKPFSLDEQTGPAKYSLIRSKAPEPQVLLDQFVENGIKTHKVNEIQSEFYPLSLTRKYVVTPVGEKLAPLTSFGKSFESISHLHLSNVFNDIKQLYAKFMQVLLLVGLIGLAAGYGFKKKLLHPIPVEYIALCISGIIVLVGQTVLPASAIDYGLLRLFQQNLIFLSLPIFLGLSSILSLVFKNEKRLSAAIMFVLLFFFAVLSGFFPQVTGGGRPLLALNNSGLYYDSYYTHAQEVASAQWLAKNSVPRIPVQAAHFSDIKMLAYGRIAPYIELLPETTKRNSYVYLNYDNVEEGNILEIIDGYVVYYHFPMEFLDKNKNLIYSNGGSEIYR